MEYMEDLEDEEEYEEEDEEVTNSPAEILNERHFKDQTLF